MQLIMCIKDTVAINCRGKPPDKNKVKEGNKISNLRTAVAIVTIAVFFHEKKVGIKLMLLKSVKR